MNRKNIDNPLKIVYVCKQIRSRMSKPIFLTFILTLIISCATHTPNPSSWLDKRSTPVTQDRSAVSQLLSNPSQYRNTTWKLCRSPLLERRNPPIERHPPFSPEFIRHLPYPDDKLLANPVTHHHLPIYFFPYLSFPLLPPPEIESPV